MKGIVLAFVILHVATVSFAQKPVVDLSVCNSWPHVGNAKISNDGKYVVYDLSQDDARPTLVIQTTDGSYKKEVPGVAAYGVQLTADCHRAIYRPTGGDLAILDLEKKTEQTLSNIASFQVPEQGDGRWLAYRLKTGGGLVLLDMFKGKEKTFTSVTDSLFDPTGKVLVCQTTNSERYTVLWIDLADGEVRTVFEDGERVSNFAFDAGGSQLAFIATSKLDGRDVHKLLLYKQGSQAPTTLVDSATPGIEKGLEIGTGAISFSANGRKVFFALTRVSASPEKADGAKVDVWNYKDEYLQSFQLNRMGPYWVDPKKDFSAVANLDDGKVVRIDGENDEDGFNTKFSKGRDADYAVVKTRHNSWEEHWHPEQAPSIYLVSTRSGARTLVKSKSYWVGQQNLSPDGKYVIYYDGDSGSYLTYEIATATTRNITKSIPFPLCYQNVDFVNARLSGFPIAGWLPKDSAVLIYDQYDIWQVDPKGVESPIDLTSGYGRKNHVVLRLVQEDENERRGVSPGEDLLLSGLNLDNKENGYYRFRVGSGAQPKLLAMGAYATCFDRGDMNTTLPTNRITFLKARDADVYVVSRESAEDAPNLYSTSDFVHYNALSNVHPQKNYNWLSSELIRWKTLDGTPSEGILYKPENFDPNKKYPIIFYFYEKDSNALNFFLYPERATGRINIPYFVSRGYLVFDCDIHYRIGHVSDSVCNSVISAAKLFAAKSWIDPTKMAVQGHSMGGYEVNCVITHTNMFAAACEAAGMCDLISNYGEMRPSGLSLQVDVEYAQTRMATTPWQNWQGYLENSPIYRADKVQTPLLIMHNNNDSAVPWAQGFEWFTALHRLGKKVWLLQYDGEDHVLAFPPEHNKEDQIDYTIRLMQFFDYYLKDTATPEWMAHGIPARLKGIDTGLELEGSGAQP